MEDYNKIIEKVAELKSMLEFYLDRSNNVKNIKDDFLRLKKRIDYWNIYAEKRLIDKYLANLEMYRKNLEFIYSIHEEFFKEWELKKIEIDEDIKKEIIRLENQRKSKNKKKISNNKLSRTKKEGANKKEETVRKQFMLKGKSDMVINAVQKGSILNLNEVENMLDVLLYKLTEANNIHGEKDSRKIEENYKFLDSLRTDIQEVKIDSTLYKEDNSEELLCLLKMSCVDKEKNEKDYKALLAKGFTLFLDEDNDRNISKRELEEKVENQKIRLFSILEYLTDGNIQKHLIHFSQTTSNIILNSLQNRIRNFNELFTIAVIDYFLNNGYFDIRSAEHWLITNIFSDECYGRWTGQLLMQVKRHEGELDYLLTNCIRDYILSPIMLEYAVCRQLLSDIEWDAYVDFLSEVYVKSFENINKDRINTFVDGRRVKIKKSQHEIGAILVKYVDFDIFGITNDEKCSSDYSFDKLNSIVKDFKESNLKEDKIKDLLEAYDVFTGFEICIELIDSLGGICLYKEAWQYYEKELDFFIGQLSRYIKIFGRHTVYLVHKIFEIVKCYQREYEEWNLSYKFQKDAKKILLCIAEILYKFNIEDIVSGVYFSIYKCIGLEEILNYRELENCDMDNSLKQKFVEKFIEKINYYEVSNRYNELKNQNYWDLKGAKDDRDLKGTEDLSMIAEVFEDVLDTKTKQNWYCVLQKRFINELNKN